MFSRKPTIYKEVTAAKAVVDTVPMDLIRSPKISISWSGGKDSALALYQLKLSGEFEITGLHTVINHDNRRLGLHGIHEELIERQAQAMTLPLNKLYLNADDTTNAYEKLMVDYYMVLRQQGIDHVMYGDIFLDDLKDFRDDILGKCGLKGVYPLWRRNSTDLLKNFLSSGFKSIMCAADAEQVPKRLVGQFLSKELIQMDIDPCGENGEYHSFVTDTPMFDKPIEVENKSIKSKEYEHEILNESGQTEKQRFRFYFADIA